MKHYVVDTNIPINANKANSIANVTQDELQLVKSCVDILKLFTLNKSAVVIDNLGHIFKEYKEYIEFAGQPGVGDEFMKWIMDNMGNAMFVKFATITPDGNSYSEYPDCTALIGFDQSDHKFVATAVSCSEKPEILQGSDSLWWIYKDAFSQLGIRVNFICPDYVRIKAVKFQPALEG
jgi:hypothetical protein